MDILSYLPNGRMSCGPGRGICALLDNHLLWFSSYIFFSFFSLCSEFSSILLILYSVETAMVKPFDSPCPIMFRQRMNRDRRERFIWAICEGILSKYKPSRRKAIVFTNLRFKEVLLGRTVD